MQLPRELESCHVAAARPFRLWIDSVGMFLICPGDRVQIGGPVSSKSSTNSAEISLLANLSRIHATIVRCGESYLLEAHAPVAVDGQLVRDRTVLSDRCSLSLGTSAKLAFRLPSPLSRTARLDFVSDHRPAQSVDGILLMDDTCLLGPASEHHVVCGDWPDFVLLYRRGAELWCKSHQALKTDGQPIPPAGAALRFGSVVTGADLQFRIEGPGGETA